MKLTADHLDAAYLAMLGEAMSVRSVQALHKTVKAAYALAVDKGQLVRNPAALATPPATVEPTRGWYSPAQVGTFLRYVAALEHSPLPVALLDALVDTGGRRGEVLGLRWEDIDLDAGTATITRQLTAHPTTRRWRSGRPSGPAPSRPWGSIPGPWLPCASAGRNSTRTGSSWAPGGHRTACTLALCSPGRTGTPFTRTL